MPLKSIANLNSPKPLKQEFFYFFLILLINFVFAKLIVQNFYDYTIFGAALTIICLIITILTFLVVWYTYESNSTAIQLLGFVFLAVAIFGFYHIIYIHRMKPFNLITDYWVLQRFIEATGLFLGTLKLDSLKVNKWLGVFFSIFFAIIISYYFPQFAEFLSLFLPEQGVINLKIIIEYMTIAILLTALYNLHDCLNNRNIITYKDIFLGILIAISAEISFIVFSVTAQSSFYYILGQLLKICYYYFLLKGIVVSNFTYPYAQLETAGKYISEILDELPIGVVTYDNKLKTSFLNKKAEKITGYRKEEVLGLSVKELARSIYKNKNQKALVEQVQNSSIKMKNKIRSLIKSDGTEVKLKFEVLKLENGRFIVLFDEAKKEQELENLQLQTETILNSIENTVLILDRNNKIISGNNAFENAVEIKAEKYLGMNIYDFNQQVQAKWKEILGTDTEGKKVYEVTFVTCNGNKKEWLLHISPIYNIEGELIGTIHVGYNVTLKKKKEQEALQREKLALLGQMAAGIVHEIKNPLTTIKGFCQYLVGKVDDEKLREYLLIIEKEANDVNKVVSDFLTFAKPNPPNLEQVSINDVISSVQLIIENNLYIKGIKLILSLSQEENKVMVDINQIKQVILNIVQNAIDAMEHTEKPCLTICTGLNKQIDEAYITIVNNGPAIPKDEIARLGTPFFSTKDKGTGLGLSICYQIIKEHGGRIDVESNLTRGTSFTISLPHINK